jgi:hypothetical protein
VDAGTGVSGHPVHTEPTNRLTGIIARTELIAVVEA